MDKNKAWQEFENTGKIDSYLKYKNIERKYKEEIGKIEGDISEINKSKGSSN